MGPTRYYSTPYGRNIQESVFRQGSEISISSHLSDISQITSKFVGIIPPCPVRAKTSASLLPGAHNNPGYWPISLFSQRGRLHRADGQSALVHAPLHVVSIVAVPSMWIKSIVRNGCGDVAFFQGVYQDPPFS